MLPLFPHEDTDRALQIVERIKPLADQFWEGHDPKIFKTNPYSAMTAAMFSPHTQTQHSRGAMLALFEFADNPAAMLNVNYEQIQQILVEHDVRFPESKAQHVLDSAQILVNEHDGVVPKDFELLMRLPGLGWKTALLTLLLAFDLAPEICVDIHVMRIGQRIGLVNRNTKQPPKVSRELMDIVPRENWKHWNPIMVYFGKNRCYPINPSCGTCPLLDICEQNSVD